MPDSKKISRIGTKDEMEMVKEDTEEFLSLLSDSETSISSPRSPGISPAHSSLTLEQFTNIVLAKEKFDTINSASEIPVTVDETVEPVSRRGARQVILPNTPASGSHLILQHNQPPAVEKLKPVVLTPRQVTFKPAPTSHPSNIVRVRQNTFTPKTSNSQQPKNPPSNNNTNTIPLYESIFSLAGSPGEQKNPLTLFPESLNSLQDQRVNDQVRRQLESVIKRNEDILKGTELIKQVRRNEDILKNTKLLKGDLQRRQEQDNSAPLNLSVRKDLMKREETEGEKKKIQRSFHSLPRDLSQTVASLINKTGGDLEITRKVKKAGKMQKSLFYDKPASVDMTPVFRQKTPEHHSMVGKRKSEYIREDEEENIKKRKVVSSIESMKDELFSINSKIRNDETLPVVAKISADCRLALHPDLHGNYPLHNAVVLSNLNLVKRFSLVLSALGKSVDLVNRAGLVGTNAEQKSPRITTLNFRHLCTLPYNRTIRL